MAYRIIQVTDPHIPVSGNMKVRDHFLALMSYCRTAEPDLLVLTGDLPSEDGSRVAYEWIRDQLPEHVPALVLPGNHDDPAALFEVFRDGVNTNPDFLGKIALDEIDLVYMNTSSTVLPDDQLRFLSEGAIRDGSVLFIHHPPRKVGGGFMDLNYPLQNHEQVDSAIGLSPVEHVFCGHYHAEHEWQGDYHLYLTPSPAFTVALDSIEPVIGEPDVPLREIVIDGRSVSTQVVRL